MHPKLQGIEIVSVGKVIDAIIAAIPAPPVSSKAD